MPLHRVGHADAPQLVAELEAAGEQITALASDEGGVYIGTTRKPKVGRPPKGLETRA